MELKIIYKGIELQLKYEKHDTFSYQLSAIKEIIQYTIQEYNNYEK